MSQSNESKKVMYCISGLGVDSRVFDRIDLPNYELIHVEWIECQPKESLASYSKRLFESVVPKENYSVMGVSFGGMIAQEWAKIQSPENLILISTAPSASAIKPILRFGGELGLTRLISPSVALIFPPLLYHYFGVNSRESKQLLKNIIRDTDPQFIRLPVAALLIWHLENAPKGIKIHGKKDRIISPPKNCDFRLENSGHFCIYDNGSKISDYLNKALSN